MDLPSQGFMLGDSRNTPMHVGGLQIFEVPPEGGENFAAEFLQQAMSYPEISPLFLKRPYRSIATGMQWTWTEDREFDIEHHVRHTALPRPGRIRELLDLVGRLHSNRLSFERPLWEFHIIEGLADGRIATYTKLHHSLVDGVSSMRLLQSVMSTDPDQRDMPPPWGAARPKRSREVRTRSDPGLLEVPLDAARSALAITSEAAGMPGALVRTLNRSFKDQPTSLTWSAPKTILNKNITGSRRFAAEDWPIERLKAVGKATGTSLNDVVLAMCGGALRSYLSELNALPEAPLISMVPVGLQAKNAGAASASGGNSVGAIMVKLGTHLADPAERLETIHQDMNSGKEALSSMSPAQIIAMAAIGNAPALLTPLLRLQGVVRPPYNVVISNVPGPKQPHYLNGARLDGMYPVSIPVNGIALNITCTSYVDQLAFGFTGCRRTVPSLQRLLVHTDAELNALEVAAGVA